MTTPINLRAARKQRDRVRKRAEADENAVKFGRTKAEKVLDAARSDHARRMLDQHRIDGEEE
ncbi:MAG: DUF4169 domain-containing protein [Confluentimicrobium sp.]|jgi:hypothetical protein|uniref:DUF4169 family protein n=1 Tax=Actibacterium sp. TaxID=1872125 RepID=UPI00050E2510|nr:DUF4169 family protein [Actibacterium sp.]KGB81960.1 amidase [Rhodovulum sp. NI22]MBC57450.1 DUF4169 domain-containing protein [Actibacterium sp.]MDY6858552.1 DUF4169 family protein [Pseudomonadota bacterium]|tara:strand:+ start:1100 stop:1285 length:186 start_codon:yes stop_codon:yes gene_type:complete